MTKVAKRPAVMVGLLFSMSFPFFKRIKRKFLQEYSLRWRIKYRMLFCGLILEEEHE